MRSFRRSLLYAALVAACVTPECNCPSDRSPPQLDAGAPDAGRDAGARDAGRDAGHDAGPWTDGVWMGMPGLPARCEAAVALDPTAVVPQLDFEACPDRPTGCRQLVVDWAPRHSSAPELDGWMLGIGSAYDDGTHGYFLLNRPDPDDPDIRLQGIVADETGAVVAVFRYRSAANPGCVIADTALGEGRFMLEFAGGETDNTPWWFVGGDLSAPASSARMVATVHGVAPQFLVTGAQQAVFEAAGADTLYRIGWDGSVARIDRADGTPATGYPGSVVGHDFVFDGMGPRPQVRISTDGAPPRVLVDPSDPDSEATFHHHTDGRTIAWLQGWHPTSELYVYERVDLYASDYATNAADIHPLFLATMSSGHVHKWVGAAFGHAAVEDGGALRLFRVADQHETDFAPPPGMIWTQFAPYIGPHELMVVAGLTNVTTNTVQIIDYGALEPAL